MKQLRILPAAWFLCFLAALVLTAPALMADDQAVIKLPPPDMNGGDPLRLAMKKRHTSREFSADSLSLQQLSDLMWAAGGLNRPEAGKATVPVMKPGSDLIIHAMLPEGLYLYDPAKNELQAVAVGDHRAAAAGPQAFAALAPLNIILSSGQKNEVAAGIIVGHSSQNVYLQCASAGLNAVTRMTMDRQGMQALLKLPEGQRPLLVLTVGPKP